MLNVYAAAAHPAGAALLASGEHEAPKGTTAVVAVALMFGILCGGIFMLLQSSFGPKIGYLVTGTAFWGSCFVLSLLWFTGVPGIPLPNTPFGNIPDVPTSTPRFLGPQGEQSSWQVVDTDAERRRFPTDEAEFIEVSPDLTDQGLTAEITAAETAAAEVIGPAYATELGVEETAILPDATFQITSTEIIRANRKVTRARVTTGPADANPTNTEDQKALIAKIKPKTFILALEPGSLSKPTYYSMAASLVLFVLHALGLGLLELRAAPAPLGAPEREKVSA
ncbi:MAG TPA: hypothetical protein VNA12_04645 [Mycobacteriales bacterium]|nr:hypothetical protein [Mycobacteriales bacterium]